MHKTRTAIMVTGGMDSTVLLYMFRDRKPIPITVNYGHTAFEKQLEMIQYHVSELNLPDPIVIDIYYNDWQKKEGLFKNKYSPNEKDPLKNWDELRYQDFFIEGRNMIMVAYALAYCSKYKVDELLAGYLYGEDEWKHRRSYKLMTGDNSPQFVDMMNMLSGVGLSYQVRFRAPYYEQRRTKVDIVKIGRSLNVDFDKTYSCYFIPACGKCDNCLLRKQILNQ